MCVSPTQAKNHLVRPPLKVYPVCACSKALDRNHQAWYHLLGGARKSQDLGSIFVSLDPTSFHGMTVLTVFMVLATWPSEGLSC